MAKLSTFLAGAAVGVVVGAAAGTVLRPHLRTIAKTAITGYYVGKRRAFELASLVTEELEDLHAEIQNQTQASASTVTDDAATPADAADRDSTSACEPDERSSTTTAATVDPEQTDAADLVARLRTVASASA